MLIHNDAIKITCFCAFIIGIICGYIKKLIILNIPEKNVTNNYNIASIDFLIQ